jgi:outer membrane protein OmpA-like peptidoglycan-associated protein
MGGIGTNIWITPKVGVYAQAAYDHVPDFTDDYFHFAFGLKFRFGAKDRDKDGIVDKKDKCPDVAGLKVFEGCPDTDKDGIEDAKDLCPNEAGKPELQGCPDKDNDGIADKDDRCPDVAGLASLKGCPDKDGDGVADIDDRCPEVKGLANLKGCPDKDGDGIADKDDKCPEVAGVSSNNGCPEVKEEIVAPVAKPAVIVYFDFNGTTVTKEEKAKLDNFSKTMAEQKEATFNIDGFADSKGNDDYNMKLSQKRADAVVKYLKKKGINVKALEVKAYGEANPVGDNETEEGRAKNRRVEVKMK